MNWARAKIICENVCGFATFALALVNNRYVLTSFPRFEIDRFLTTGCCLVIQRAQGIIHFLFSTRFNDTHLPGSANLPTIGCCNARQSGSPLAFIPIRDFQHDDDDCMAAIDEL